MSLWDTLQAEVANCTKCPLQYSRRKPVFGVGDQRAQVLFVGEGPGEVEDEVGQPFVGRTGKYLRKTMARAGFIKGQVYITNAVRCRPPENRAPEKEEIQACSDYLKRHILLIRPKVVVAVGAVAYKAIVDLCEFKGAPRTITTARGDMFDVSLDGHEFKLGPIWHPSYVLRSHSKLKEIELFRDLRRVHRSVFGEKDD